MCRSQLIPIPKVAQHGPKRAKNTPIGAEQKQQKDKNILENPNLTGYMSRSQERF